MNKHLTNWTKSDQLKQGMFDKRNKQSGQNRQNQIKKLYFQLATGEGHSIQDKIIR
ncbi:hypothetical protein [Thalassomonas haliotis]|uniref:Transposase n=1 Tax=Thalassomonas haliotis TaxID=485448 RepID=A0ABY7VJK2_9GAMM|nr:hypothetical protein [Thalassomonas haliotis]WDE13567.1 hypothetical protein H3N35_09100 [Thalassomonas haliotis]